jgi:hypothetical protein
MQQYSTKDIPFFAEQCFANLEIAHRRDVERTLRQAEAGTPTIIIMAITGHKTESAFMKYIKTKPKDKAIILKDLWATRLNAKLIQLSA